MELVFYKYQGTGNDFIVLDNRINEIRLDQHQIKLLCHRKLGIGADGLMLLEADVVEDFKMKYFNSDGNEGTMCGNGGRCLVQFAKDRGIEKDRYRFIAIDGLHEAFFSNDGINLQMKDVESVVNHWGHFELNTGSPHYVKFVQSLEGVDVLKEGRAIRNSKEYLEKGINVNFVELQDEDKIKVRTYERGVEDETLSCGTGVTAAALVSAHNESGYNRIAVETLGGNLVVEYDKIGEDKFRDIWLCGPATFVFEGKIKI